MRPVFPTVAQIVDLSRKQSGLREACRAISARIKTRGEHGTWVAAGKTFIKLPASKVKSFLEDGNTKRKIIAKICWLCIYSKAFAFLVLNLRPKHILLP